MRRVQECERHGLGLMRQLFVLPVVLFIRID